MKGLPVRVRVPNTATLSRLLGTALQYARGEIVAITDTNCELDDSWAATLLQVHKSVYPVIGGSVEPGPLRGLVNWAAYLTDYSPFMLPLTEGITAELPGNNISMKRWTLEHGQEFTHGEFWKTYGCGQLQSDGFQLHMSPQLTVRYRCAYDLWPFLGRHHGRCFAGMRLQQLGGIKLSLISPECRRFLSCFWPASFEPSYQSADVWASLCWPCL